MNTLLNAISVTAAFILAANLIHSAFDYTIGRIKVFNSEWKFYGFQIKDFVFYGIALLIIFKYITFYKPY